MPDQKDRQPRRGVIGSDMAAPLTANAAGIDGLQIGMQDSPATAAGALQTERATLRGAPVRAIRRNAGRRAHRRQFGIRRTRRLVEVSHC